jgi:hypothetical protein
MDEQAKKSKEQWSQASSHGLRGDYAKAIQCLKEAWTTDKGTYLRV